MQGLIQFLFLHASLEEHSESDEHPASMGSTTNENTIIIKLAKIRRLDNNILEQLRVSLLILSQRTSPFPVNPGKQVQLIVRRGRVLCT